jgi:hypothetical protein
MSKKLHKLLFIICLFNLNTAFADNKVELKISETSQLDQIHEALDEFTRFDTKNNIIYEQKRREMLDSIETRFHACDPDNDNTLDVYETTVCLPQVARQFRQVDINNDNVISLDELSILAKDFHSRKTKQNTANSENQQLKENPKASLPIKTPTAN